MFTAVFCYMLFALTIMPTVVCSATTSVAHTPQDCVQVEECTAFEAILLQTEYKYIPNDGADTPSGQQVANTSLSHDAPLIARPDAMASSIDVSTVRSDHDRQLVTKEKTGRNIERWGFAYRRGLLQAGQKKGKCAGTEGLEAGVLAANHFLQRQGALDFPKVVWIYWKTGLATAPLLVKACVAQLKKISPDWDVRVLNETSVYDWLTVPEVMLMKETPSVQHSADVMRLKVLHKYGGLYMDASVVATEPLDWLVHKMESQDVFMYDISSFASESKDLEDMLQFPIFENSIIAAKRGAMYVGEWSNIFQLFMQIINNGCFQYLDLFKSRGYSTGSSWLRHVGDFWGQAKYLVQHEAGLFLLQEKYNAVLTSNHSDKLAAVKFYGLDHQSTLEPGGALRYAKLSNWNEDMLVDSLTSMPLSEVLKDQGDKDNPPKLVKFNSRQRKAMEKRMRKGKVVDGSFAALYLNSSVNYHAAVDKPS